MVFLVELKFESCTCALFHRYFTLLEKCAVADVTNVTEALLHELAKVSKMIRERIYTTHAHVYAQLHAHDALSDLIFEPSCFALPLTFEHGLCVCSPSDNTPHM